MRRFQALLITAGLAATPAGAVAGPSHHQPGTDAQSFETFEWSASKGRLGLVVMSMTPELREHLGTAGDRGVLVARVDSGSPAAAAGIQVGDVVVRVRGERIAAATDVRSAISRLKKGETAEIDVVRDGKPLTLHAKLTDDAQPDMQSMFQSMFDEQTGWFHDLRDWFGGPNKRS